MAIIVCCGAGYNGSHTVAVLDFGEEVVIIGNWL